MPHKPNQADTPNTITHCIMHVNSRLPVVPPVTIIVLIRHDACRCQSAIVVSPAAIVIPQCGATRPHCCAAFCPAAPCHHHAAHCCAGCCSLPLSCHLSLLSCHLSPCCPLPSLCRPSPLSCHVIVPPIAFCVPWQPIGGIGPANQGTVASPMMYRWSACSWMCQTGAVRIQEHQCP